MTYQLSQSLPLRCFLCLRSELQQHKHTLAFPSAR
jgi:hypothetical protein